ncbi:MAG: hypothetical protein IJK63_02240 [Oscillospiraceae bacterium]|nr:hypothetical protein [Oscillospiraceae bacterium]
MGMALDAEYFDSIYIDVVKKKYYNADKVQEVFADIRKQAEALTAENESLRKELDERNARRLELGDAVLSAQTIYQDVVDRAKARAAEITDEAELKAAGILAAARKKSEAILADARRQQDGAVRKVETAFNRTKQLHLASIEELNAQWRDFLCGLYPDAETSAPAPTAPVPAAPAPEPELHADLEEKVGAIADQLFAMDEE